ncbi:MAG: helix-turn-helix domain-containing protein [Gaiellaceae bacterium]
MAGETETIGQRLRRLRLERGLSQRALAEPGVSYAYISRIEAGTRQPSVKALRKLAPKLGVSADYLETGSDLSPSQQRELRLADASLRLRLGLDTVEAERDLRALLDEALALGDTRAAIQARIALGSAAVATGRPTEAIELLEPAAHDDGLSPASRPDVFYELGRAYAYVGRVDKAIALYDRCLEETRENEPENVAALVRYATALSYALTDAGQLDRAQEVLSEVVDDAAGALADPGAQVKLYWSLARLAGLRGEHTSSLDYARRALALIDATEDTIELGRAHLLCGYILVAQEDAARAQHHLDRAEELLGSSPRPTDLAYLRTEQAKAALLVRDGDEAVRRARESLELLGDLDPGEQGAAWLALARGLELQGETNAAFEAFRRSAETLEGADKLADAAEACRAWGRALRAAARENEAMDVLERAAELAVAAGRTTAPAARTR